MPMESMVKRSRQPRCWIASGWAAIAVVLAATLGHVAPARAAFPGSNGLIAFQTPDGIGVAPPGGDPTLLGPPARRSTFVYPAWSADGSRIAFVKNFARLCVMDADGTDVRCVGGKGNGTEWPAWSPDNSTVVFARRSDLWSVDVDATVPTPVNLTNTPNVDEGYPSCSPDGSLIAFDRNSGGHTAIFVMGPDGEAPEGLTDGSLTTHDPDWSPDGTQILFQLYPTAGTNVLALMDADGGDQHVIYDRSVGDPVFSPDGQRIAFTLLTGPNLIPRIWRIWTDGSHLRRIVSDTQGGHFYFPSWQPVAG